MSESRAAHHEMTGALHNLTTLTRCALIDVQCGKAPNAGALVTAAEDVQRAVQRWVDAP